jgi:hypothetical protein
MTNHDIGKKDEKKNEKSHLMKMISILYHQNHLIKLKK